MMTFRAFVRRHCTDEAVVLLIATVLGIISANYLYGREMLTGDNDAVANLVIARFVSESVTPGISQLGVWNMLIHIVLIPAVLVDVFFYTGIAGFVTLFPFMCFAAVCLYRMGMMLSGSRWIGYLAALIFICNPYILYYSTAPMSEMLLISSMVGSAYFYLRWSEGGTVNDLLYCGVFVSLASMSRIEGFLLAPASFFLVFVRLLTQRVPWRQLMASLTLFGSLAGVGATAVMVYSWVYTGNPVYFISYTPVVTDTVLTRSVPNFERMAYVLWLAAANMVSSTLIVTAIALTPLAALFCRRIHKMSAIGALLILCTTPVFVIITVMSGARPVFVPELHEISYNVRYTLQFVPFFIMCCITFASAISALRPRMAVLQFVRKAVLVALCIWFVITVPFHAYDVVFRRGYNGAPQFSQTTKTNQAFSSVYDYGFVLTTYFNNVGLPFYTFVPMRNFVYEANYRYFTQAAREPWLFTRWVVRHSARDGRPNAFSVLIKVNNPEFQYYYEFLMRISNSEGHLDVYRLREDRMRLTAEKLGIDPNNVPSLKLTTVPWDPATIYETLLRES